MLLPPPISTYFDADTTGSVDVLVEAFTTDATVRDEGRTYSGRPVIEAWWRETKAKYQTVLEPVEASGWDKGVQVLAKVTGELPGSPVMLRFTFDIVGDQIARLEIGV